MLATGSVTETTFNAIHWIFAMQYWVLARKLKLIKNKQDPLTNSKLYTIVYYIGLALNVICGIFYGLPTYVNWEYILS